MSPGLTREYAEIISVNKTTLKPTKALSVSYERFYFGFLFWTEFIAFLRVSGDVSLVFRLQAPRSHS